MLSLAVIEWHLVTAYKPPAVPTQPVITSLELLLQNPACTEQVSAADIGNFSFILNKSHMLAV